MHGNEVLYQVQRQAFPLQIVYNSINARYWTTCWDKYGGEKNRAGPEGASRLRRDRRETHHDASVGRYLSLSESNGFKGLAEALDNKGGWAINSTFPSLG